MSNGEQIYVWQMVREVAQELRGERTYPEIYAQVWAKYGKDINVSSMRCSIVSAAVNHPSRIHYSENKKSRIANTERDFFYSTGHGRVVWYDPAKDAAKYGLWEIVKKEDNSLAVVQVDNAGDLIAPSDMDEGQDSPYSMFALEAHLRDYLAKSLPTMSGHSRALKLYANAERDGVEFQTDVGPIDILAISDVGDLYVFELKLARGEDKALGQILRYMGWVKTHLAGGKNVYGVIVAADANKKLRYAVTQVPHVQLMEYKLSVSLSPVVLPLAE